MPAITNGNLLFPSCSGLKSFPEGVGVEGTTGVDGIADDGAVHAGAVGVVDIEEGPQFADPATGVGAVGGVGDEKLGLAGDGVGGVHAGADGTVAFAVSVAPKEGVAVCAAGGNTGLAGAVENGWTGGVPGTGGICGADGGVIPPNPAVVFVVSFIE